MRVIFLVHVFSTLMMCGIIWIIQCLHYPLFAYVGEIEFQQYEILHRTWISPIVGPLMLLELGSAIWLVFNRPSKFPRMWAIMGLGLVGMIWLSTFLLQVPLHNQITQSFDAEAIDKLVNSNWVRTVAWSLRALLIGMVLKKFMD